MVRNVNNEVSIIIADNNEDFALEMENSLKAIPNFKVIGKAYDGETAVKEIIEKKPDIVILELVMPLKDGIAILEELQENISGKKPVIIVLTAIGNDKFIKKALSLGAEYYILKPFDLNLLPKRVIQVYNDTERKEKPSVNYKIYVKTGAPEAKKIKKDNLRESLEFYVKKALMDIEVPAHLSGYAYLQMAIIENVLCERGTIPITKKLYPMIAEYYNTSPGRVERAIRNAIQKVWQKGNPQELSQYFSYSKDRKSTPPTNSEFISTIADKIKLTYLLNIS